MQYTPMHGAMRLINRETFFDDHIVMLWVDIEQVGPVKYEYLLGIFDKITRQPVYFVSSEVNAMAALLGGGSHALCVFDDDGHANMGFSDNWADESAFFAEAGRLARERFSPPLKP
jgi:hypothetical protein